MKQPQPFFRQQTRSWYVQFGKRQISLGKDEQEAMRRYHELMAGRRKLAPADPVAFVADEFLEWVKNNKAAATYTFYKRHLDSFVDFIGLRLKFADLIALHVTRWIADRYPGRSETTRNSAISAVERAVNWAVKQGIIDRSPLHGIEKPPRNRREVFLTPEQYAQILTAVKDQPFRDFLTTLWETGCRPQEARKVEARHFIAERGIWMFERLESKGKKKRRQVYLNETALEITQRLARQHPCGPIFRNTKGKPWTKDALNCRFRRLKKTLGFDVHCYAVRHGFATVALVRGVDSLSVSKLMGHSDTKMLEWVYQHIDGNDEFLRGALNRANGQGA